MNINKNGTLIDFKGKPKKVILYSFLTYICITLLFIIFCACKKPLTHIKLYFYINIITAVVIAWFLSKSLRTQPYERYVAIFRIGLFTIYNCLLIILLAGLGVIAEIHAIVIVSILFIPAILLIIISFNDFISFVNFNYQSAVKLSLTDELTGLPNRRSLNFTLRELDKKLATICLLDIDHFKKINDTFGHEIGDQVLVFVGLALKQFANENISISRSGGEEFCIIINGEVDAKKTISDIKQAMTFDYNPEIKITFSIGVATKHQNENFSSAMISADEALYRAKREGRNCIVVADDGGDEGE